MKAADISGKKQNRARGAVSAAEAAVIEHANKPFEKRKTPMSLDPRIFAHKVKIEESDAGNEALRAAQSAFENFSKAVDQIHTREVTIRADKTRTPEDHNLRVSKIASNAVEPVAKRADHARNRLVSEINGIDRHIEHETKSRLSQPEQQEIRAHVKSLSDEARRKLLAKADDDSVSAVLAGKSYLSGMGPAEAQKIDYEWKQRKFPEQQVLRAKYERALDQIDTGWQNYLNYTIQLSDPDANSIERAMESADAAVKAALNLDDES